MHEMHKLACYVIARDEMTKQAVSIFPSGPGKIRDLVRALAESGAGLPVLGGVAGMGLSLPMAIPELERGEWERGLGTAALGGGLGALSGLLGRNAFRARATAAAEYNKLLRALNRTTREYYF